MEQDQRRAAAGPFQEGDAAAVDGGGALDQARGVPPPRDDGVDGDLLDRLAASQEQEDEGGGAVHGRWDDARPSGFVPD